jgi:hypothetical protein
MLKKLGGVLVSLAPVSAFAEVPAAVTTAMADMKTDALVVAAAFLVAIIAIRAFGLMKRA